MTFTKSSNRNAVGQLYKIRETESTNDLFLTSYLGLILPRHLTGDLTLSAQLILVLCNAMVQSLVTVSLYINHKSQSKAYECMPFKKLSNIKKRLISTYFQGKYCKLATRCG